MEKDKNILSQYAGLGAQLIAGLVFTVYGGLWLDKYFALKTPVLIWVLPLLFIFGLMVKLVKDASKKNL